jgi:pyruvate dehydrogenase E2 component (dihydrolipoamide acetyltransferase)
MAKEMTLPKIGVNMTEATIVEWMVKEGDTIQEGDHILTAETDKATQEIYSTQSGVLAQILAKEGETVQTQQTIAVISESGEDIESAKKTKPATENSENTSAPQSAPMIESPSSSASPGMEHKLPLDRVRISPLAKKSAKDLGIDFRCVPPAKPGARITKKDVDAYVQGRPITGADAASTDMVIDRTIPLSGIRKTIGERMTQSVTTMPRAILNVRVDAENLLAWKKGCAERGNKVGMTDLIVKAAARAVSEYPLLNSRLVKNEIHIFKNVNVGVAVDTEKGLMVPVIHNAAAKGVVEISTELREKAARARAGNPRPEDLQNGTITITNLGMIGIEQFIPVINPPECAILAVGSIVREPMVIDETDDIVVKPMFWISLAFDHRIIDGVPTGRFLMELKKILEWPLSLAD